MKFIREASEDEMILEFLRGEIKSERFQAQIMEVLKSQNENVEIIINADLNNLNENLKRKEILSIFRGYGSNTELFENFPNISKWIFAECTDEDVNKIHYINYSYWNELSKHTGLPLVAAETIRENKEIYNVSNSGFISGVKYLEEGGVFSPIILLTASNENYLILEGHSRMTVYSLAPSFFEGTNCYIGICEERELSKWNS